MHSVLRFMGRMLATVMIVAGAGILVAAVIIPRVAGATPYVVLTGSMVPTYPPGTLVVDRPADIDSLHIGDVVTYQLQSGQPEVVTHRIVAVTVTGADKLTFTTQGDANNVADASPVIPQQIRGQVWYAIPYLGYLVDEVTGALRQEIVIAAVVFLGAYAIWQVASKIKEKRVPQHPGKHTL